MAFCRLEEMTWPEVQREIAAGRDTVVVPFGAVEQHGPHLPLGTDAIFGDEVGKLVADRLGAFIAPTVRIGCSSHHLSFAGTISLEDETFYEVVRDVVRTLARHGFRRLVLLPTHGGNFKPLGEAVNRMGPQEGVRIITFPDVSFLMSAILPVASSLGLTPAEGGIHAGEWETSMMLAFRPDLVRMAEAEVGYTGDLMSGIQKFFEEGVHAVSDNGVFGDPRRASAGAGRRYVDRIVEAVVKAIESSS